MSLTLYSNLNCSGHCTWWKTRQLSVMGPQKLFKRTKLKPPSWRRETGKFSCYYWKLSHQQEKLKVHCNLSKLEPHKAAGISWTPSPPQREDNKVNIRINEQIILSPKHQQLKKDIKSEHEFWADLLGSRTKTKDNDSHIFAWKKMLS